MSAVTVSASGTDQADRHGDLDDWNRVYYRTPQAGAEQFRDAALETTTE